MKKHRTRRPKKTFVYLASQSPRRKEILSGMGIRFKIVSSAYHEKKIEGLAPDELVLSHAVGKARGARLKGKKGIVLGADTIVYCDGEVLGKPASQKEAVRMLKLLSGRSHYVYTGVALEDRETGKVVKAFDKTRVYFRKFLAGEIEKYIKAVNSFDKAGAYAIQMRPKVVTKIKGSYSNVMGLPKEVVRRLLKKLKNNYVAFE